MYDGNPTKQRLSHIPIKTIIKRIKMSIINSLKTDLSEEFATKLTDIAKDLHVTEAEVVEMLLKKYRLAPEKATPITFKNSALEVNNSLDTYNLAAISNKQCQCRNNRGNRCNKKTGLKLALVPFGTAGNALVWMCSEHIKSGLTLGPHQGPVLYRDFHPCKDLLAIAKKV
jgi:plasmid maintenance system antidote protein VapI